MSGTTIIIGPVRTSYFHGWEAKAPKGSTKAVYSTQLVWEDSDEKTTAKIKGAIEAAEAEGKSKLEGTPLKKQRRPLYTGSEEFPGDDFYKDKFYVNASNTRQPGIAKKVKGKVVPIIDEDEMYSGAWVYAELNFFAYDNVGVGIGCSLQNILKYKDDERLDGRRSAEQAFGGVDFGDTEEDDTTPKNIQASSNGNGVKESKKAEAKEETGKGGKTGKPSPFDDDEEEKGGKAAGKKPNPFD